MVVAPRAVRYAPPDSPDSDAGPPGSETLRVRGRVPGLYRMTDDGEVGKL